MKISYILQLKDFGIMLTIGFLLGCIYGVLNICCRIRYRFAIQLVTDLLFSLLAVIGFVISVNIVNMGQIRVFLCIAYLFGFALERITLGKLFAKGYVSVYNTITNMSKKFANSRFGRVLFK